jgi:putative phosphoribosyl transferase
VIRMFHDRTQVGKLLAEEIRKLKIVSPIVLAIPRGGLPVAREIALALKAPLDLVITRKIGAPGEPEFAIGAVTQDGEVIVDREVVKSLGISEAYLKQESARKVHEIKERMQKYRGERPYPNLAGKTVIIVDDGVATGNTVLAAIESVKKKKPAGIILAIGVAPPETATKLSKVVDRVICLDTPEPFYAIGEFYENFEQVEDEEAKKILSEVNPENSIRARRAVH